MGLEAWRSTAEVAINMLLTQSESMTLRLQRLESAQPPPPPPFPPQPSTAPPQPLRDGQLHSISTRLCSRRCAHLHCPRSGPAGTTLLRDVGSGILRSHPPHPVTGTFAETNPSSSHFRDSSSSASGKAPHLPKLEFPKFDGDNPCLWRDHCDMYFEVFSVSPDLKTATL